jgi:hypothetical protein
MTAHPSECYKIIAEVLRLTACSRRHWKKRVIIRCILGSNAELYSHPTEGLIPTTLLLLEGHVMLPSVSLPSVTAASPIAAATPLPDELPHGSPFGKYGFVHCPPLPLHPDGWLPRNSANSERFAFPSRFDQL